MPRGYLKRFGKQVGRNVARGGGTKQVRTFWNKSNYSERDFFKKKIKDEAKLMDFIAEEGKEEVLFDPINYDSESSSEKEKTIQEKKVTEYCTTEMNNRKIKEEEDMVKAREEQWSFEALNYSCAESYSYSVLSENDDMSFSIINDHFGEEDNSSSMIWEFVLCTKEKILTDKASLSTEHETPVHLVQESQSAEVCAICMDSRPTSRLMNKCKHPQACIECLRTHYVHNMMQDVANYPLQCYWPECDRLLRDMHIQKLTSNPNDMQLFYQNEIYSKERRKAQRQVELKMGLHVLLQNRRVQNFQTVQCCSHCSTHNPIFPCLQDTFICAECHSVSNIDVISRSEVIAIVKALGDVLVNCPSCSVLIAKDGGCDHMSCICGKNFSFEEARIK